MAERRAQWENLPAGTTSARSRPRNPSASAIIRQEAARESEARRYLYLACGHLGDKEDTVRMQIWRPSNINWFCDVEGIWTTVTPVIRTYEYLEKAPF